jgi:glycosyltransferase involved in cell wall biosynthesis
MNILFINYHSFASNSAIHIFHLANALTDLGEHCAVCVTRGQCGAGVIGTPRFVSLTYLQALRRGATFPDGRGPDIIHAWTPRECVRWVTTRLARRHQCPFLVHLEDNEETILARRLGRPYNAIQRMPGLLLTARVGRYLSHPARYRQFLDQSAGVTILIDRLEEFVPAGHPSLLFWPACEADLLHQTTPPAALRERLHLADEDLVVFYPGNITRANAGEVEQLYLAITRLNERGVPARLIHTGMVDEAKFVQRLGLNPDWFHELGFVPRTELGSLYGAADVLVQPGRADAFNEYRFPAKLPEFLATGKPVLLPRTNLGHHLTDGENAVLLTDGTSVEIAGHLQALWQDPARRRRIGAAGQTFAQAHFSWDISARKLRAFYAEILG